jgi:(p)ppGpp synthase/HD superfamily hydrolase
MGRLGLSYSTTRGAKMTILWDPDLYNRTMWFAGRVHKEQKIPGQEIPYLLHLAQVCQEALGAAIADSGLDGNLVMQCAILHDTIEDTECLYEDVLQEFGVQVADGVDALSKRKSINGEPVSKPEQMKDSLGRIREQGSEIWVVKLADRITNLQRPPVYWTAEKIRGYHTEACRILEALGSASVHLSARMQQKLKAYENYM